MDLPLAVCLARRARVEGERAEAMIQPQSTPDPRWRQKVRRSIENGRPICGAVVISRRRPLCITTADADVTCGRCRRMLRLVELGLKAKAPKR
jgi:hypothetical protein